MRNNYSDAQQTLKFNGDVRCDAESVCIVVGRKRFCTLCVQLLNLLILLVSSTPGRQQSDLEPISVDKHSIKIKVRNCMIS